MLTPSELDRRLEFWGREYGGGRYENVGYPSRSSIAGFRDGVAPKAGGAPPARNEADEVEHFVGVMQKQGVNGEAAAHCLRARYCSGCRDEAARLRMLRAIGHRVGNVVLAGLTRSQFYNRAALARERVGWALYAIACVRTKSML